MGEFEGQSSAAGFAEHPARRRDATGQAGCRRHTSTNTQGTSESRDIPERCSRSRSGVDHLGLRTEWCAALRVLSSRARATTDGHQGPAGCRMRRRDTSAGVSPHASRRATTPIRWTPSVRSGRVVPHGPANTITTIGMMTPHRPVATPTQADLVGPVRQARRHRRRGGRVDRIADGDNDRDAQPILQLAARTVRADRRKRSPATAIAEERHQCEADDRDDPAHHPAYRSGNCRARACITAGRIRRMNGPAASQ